MAAAATIALFFLVCVSDFSLASARGGFTVDLIHRDSPSSPFYDPSQTPSQRLKNAFSRSFSRVNHFNTKGHHLSSSAVHVQPNQAEATIINNSGEYLMELSIGTPPFPIKAIADTGSDLLWTQCEPCVNCYKQRDPLFNPKSSSTYRTIPCTSDLCDSLRGTCTSNSTDVCLYEVMYGDQSKTLGDYAADTVTLASTTGRNESFPKTIIGCGHNNSGTFNEVGSGIVGLGGGAESLISQMGTSIDGKFSYCLVPLSSRGEQSSKLSFGENAVVWGSGVLSTPIFKDPKKPTFFYLTLEAISVDDTKIPFSSSSPSSSDGNIIIDSGTTLTILEKEFYTEVEDAVDQVVRKERVTIPQLSSSLCYKVSESEEFKGPKITMHFSGAVVELEDSNVFVRVSEDVICFTFAPAEGLSIYGNLAQAGFLVGYDLQGSTVSFKLTDCTKV